MATSVLQAVNRMLGAIGEAPVNSLVAPQPPEAFIAEAVLDEASTTVQAEGWRFNTSFYAELNAETDGSVLLPDTCLQAKFDALQYPDRQYQARGNRVYDVTDRTYVIYAGDLPLQAIITDKLAWEELPEVAKSYIIYRATRIFSARLTGSETINSFTIQEESQLKAALKSWDMELAQENMLTGTPGGSATNFPGYMPRTAAWRYR